MTRARLTGPLAALTGLVLLTFAARLLLALQFDHPVAFVDELIHAGAGKRLALGESPAVPGASHGYGLGYPLLLAPLYWAAGNPEAAYPLIKALNALAFALATIPAYLLARRVARPRYAFAAAVLTALLPAGAYASFVLTESVALLTFLLACLAIVRVTERPTVVRQVVALAACGAGVEVRRQSIVLVGALVAVPVAVALLERSQRLIRALWPTWTVIGSAAAVGIVWLTAQGTAEDAMGGYSVLARGYDLVDTLSWGRILCVTMIPAAGVLPAILLPAGVASALRSGPARGPRALVALTLSLTTLVLVQVALFSTTPYSLERVHERYLGYVVPLLVALLAGWISRGMPFGARPVVAGAAAAFVLPWALPGIGGIAPSGFDNPALAALGYPADPGVIGGGRLVPSILCGLIGLVALLAWRRRSAALAFGAVAAVFLFVGVSHQLELLNAKHDVQTWATGGPTASPRDWIDRAIGPETPVMVLAVSADPECPTAREDDIVGNAALWNVSFYNSGIERVISLGGKVSSPLRVERATVSSSGLVRIRAAGVQARYVAGDRRLRVRGRLIAFDRATRWALWDTSGALAVADGATVRGAVCGRAAGRLVRLT